MNVTDGHTSHCPHYNLSTQAWFKDEKEPLTCPPSFEYPCSHPDYQAHSSRYLWQQYMDAPLCSQEEDLLGDQLANMLTEYENGEDEKRIMREVKEGISEAYRYFEEDIQRYEEIMQDEGDVDMAETIKSELLDVYSKIADTTPTMDFTA